MSKIEVDPAEGEPKPEAEAQEAHVVDEAEAQEAHVDEAEAVAEAVVQAQTGAIHALVPDLIVVNASCSSLDGTTTQNMATLIEGMLKIIIYLEKKPM